MEAVIGAVVDGDWPGSSVMRLLPLLWLVVGLMVSDDLCETMGDGEDLEADEREDEETLLVVAEAVAEGFLDDELKNPFLSSFIGVRRNRPLTIISSLVKLPGTEKKEETFRRHLVQTIFVVSRRHLVQTRSSFLDAILL